MRARFVLLVGAVLAITVGGIAVWTAMDTGPDAVLLNETGFTFTPLDTVSGSLSDGTQTAPPRAAASIAPGFDDGEVIRVDAGAEWYRQQIHDRADSPHVLATTVCPGAPAFVAVGHLGDDLTNPLDEIDRAEASVWRSVDGTEWSPVELEGRPQEATLLDIATGAAFGQPSLLVAVGQTLSAPVTAIVAVSPDCGATWTIDDLDPGADSLPTADYLIAGAITADQSGFLIAGATETAAGRSVVLWSSADAAAWTPQTRPDNATLRGVPARLRRDGDAVVVIERTRDEAAALLFFDGTPGSWFTGGANAGPDLATSAIAQDESSLVIVGGSNAGDWHELMVVDTAPDASLLDRLRGPDPADVRGLRLVDTDQGLQLVVETVDFELEVYRLVRS